MTTPAAAVIAAYIEQSDDTLEQPELLTALVGQALAAERERCAKKCMSVWQDEPHITTQNGLADGCLASARALRELRDGE